MKASKLARRSRPEPESGKLENSSLFQLDGALMKDLLMACLMALALGMPAAHSQVSENSEPEIRVQDTPRDQAIQDRLRAVMH